MNRDNVIRLAHEADCLDPQHYGSAWADKLERFAALVAAAEKEENAKLRDALWDLLQDTQHLEHDCGDVDHCPVLNARKLLERIKR